MRQTFWNMNLSENLPEIHFMIDHSRSWTATLLKNTLHQKLIREEP